MCIVRDGESGREVKCGGITLTLREDGTFTEASIIMRGGNEVRIIYREGDNGIAQAWISIMNYSNGTHSIAKIYSGTAIEGLTKAATKAALLFQ